MLVFEDNNVLNSMHESFKTKSKKKSFVYTKPKKELAKGEFDDIKHQFLNSKESEVDIEFEKFKKRDKEKSRKIVISDKEDVVVSEVTNSNSINHLNSDDFFKYFKE